MVKVMIACNDDRGEQSGRCSGIDFEWEDSGDFVRFESDVLASPVCRIFEDSLKLSNRTYRIRSHTEWVGNMAWDLVTMHENTAKSLLRHLRSDPRWTVTEETVGCLSRKLARRISRAG